MEALGISDGLERYDCDACAADDHAAGASVAATGGAPHQNGDRDEAEYDAKHREPTADDASGDDEVKHQRADDDEDGNDEDLPRLKRAAHGGHAIDGAVCGVVGFTAFRAKRWRRDASQRVAAAKTCGFGLINRGIGKWLRSGHPTRLLGRRVGRIQVRAGP